MIWNKEQECMSRSKLEALQLERLQNTVRRVYENVLPYRRKMDELGVRPEHIRTLKDLALLPFTTKEDLRQNYPFGLFAVPQRDVVRVHGSSGTTGKPIVVGYTANDLKMWADLLARIITAASVGPDDIAQVAFNYGLFTGGFGLHYGLEAVGATVVPLSGGNTEKQLMLMQDFGTTALIATPSYALHIAEVAEGMGIDTNKLKLRVGLFGGESSSSELRMEIEKRLHIVTTDNYGLTEVMGPGVAGECIYATGMHIAEDYFVVETIDPDTFEVLPAGSEGELVITSLAKEAFPVIRYRTKDISHINQEPCICGRTMARIGKLVGRTDDMLIIRGVNVFPSQIEEILFKIEGLGSHYQIHVYREGSMDELEIQVELADTSLLDSYKALEELTGKIKNRMKIVLGISCRVKLLEPFSIQRGAGKAKRVVDHRK